ncbi:MAG TPA: hypothetical protein VMR41_04985 [Patescibacteria group bacterium]|nr:hypothetical protein [Patescibacteria group bacterium]
MNKQSKILSQQMIEDFVLSMEHKGLSREAIEQILSQAIDEVEEEVVDELMEKLPEDKKQLLDALVAQGTDAEEIARQLEIDQEELEESESEKFAEILEEMTEKL